MPPLLPEYLAQPFQIVAQSTTTDWEGIVAGGLFTLVGAALGAWLGSKGAYKATLKANRSIVNQSKLEECLTLIGEIRSVYIPFLSSLAKMPKAHGLADAKILTAEVDPDQIVCLARKIRTLSTLHALPVSKNAEALVAISQDVCRLIKNINNRSGLGGQDIIDNWRSYSSQLFQMVNHTCRCMEKYIVEKAKT